MGARRILFVGTSLGWRGTEVHFVTLAKHLAARGHPVAALVARHSPTWKALEDTRVERIAAFFRNAGDPRGAFALLRAVRRLRPELIVGSYGHEYWPIGVAGSLAGVRTILFRHLPTRLKPLTARRLPRLIHRFVAVSGFIERRLLEDGVPAEKVALLYNPLDLQTMRRDEATRAKSRGELGVGREDFLVGFIGSLERSKGIHVLASALEEAMRAHPRMRALWVGQQDRHANVRALLSPELLPRHRFSGWVPDPAKLFCALDLCAVPSVWDEPMARVSIEAQAWEVPVLLSATGGLAEAVSAPSMLVPRGDVAAWSKRLGEAALLSPEELRRWGLECREFVARFDVNRICEQFETQFLP